MYDLPAWSPAWNSYRNEVPVGIGHWFTNEGPSAQLVLFWKNPCQCWGRNIVSREILAFYARALTIDVDFIMSAFVRSLMTLS